MACSCHHNENHERNKRLAPMLRRTWYTIICLSGSSLLLSSPWRSSMAAATTIADDATATVIHDRKQQRPQQRRRRMRDGGRSTLEESSPSSLSGSNSRSMVECATAYSSSTDYQPGDIVSRKGKMYQCRPHPYSLWCSNGSYAPGGASGYWSEAWILLNFGEKCEKAPVTIIAISATTEGSLYGANDKPVLTAEAQTISPMNTNDNDNGNGRVEQLPQCAPAFKLQEYDAGELASKNSKNYKCKNHPYTQWCGLEAYAPGTKGSMSAWIPLGDCSKDIMVSSTVKPPTKRPSRLPSPSMVNSNGSGKVCAPKFQAQSSYERGELVSWNGKNFRCTVSQWCHKPKFQPSNKKYWKLVWYPIGSCKNNAVIGSGQNGRPTRRPTRRPTASRPANKPNKPASSSSQSNPATNPKPRPMTPRPMEPSISKPANQPTRKPKPATPTPPTPTGNSADANNSSTVQRVYDILDSKSSLIDDTLFLYQGSTPSEVYRYKGFIDGLKVMVEAGVAGKTFYLGDDSQNGYLYGLANIAAFLGQSMKETIQYDACDENSWDLVDMKYPLSNACGQLGQSYQDYHCSEAEKHMECKVDPQMSIKGTTHAKWYGAPGPMFCGPKSEYPFTGFWDYNYQCDNPWATPPQSCTDYEGQQAGRVDNTSPVANRSGRTDVEGCCWWGRGVIQTTGVCNFGKLNYFLGKRAQDEGRDSRYPEIDFCKDPQIICSSEEHKELKWIAGMFYWIESLQSYNVGGWDYITELKKYVDNGMADNSFIDAVSGIVNRGCHNPPCAAGPVDGGFERSENFKKVLTTLNS